jgi:hypothetical protein
MKKYILLLTTVLVLCFIQCDKEKTNTTDTVNVTSLSFTACNLVTKSTGTEAPSMQLTGQTDNRLLIRLTNTEFCCGTDSVSIDCSIKENDIHIVITDLGPYTHCFCPHDLEFSIGALDQGSYSLTLMESENAYLRDTFIVAFSFTQQLDTTIIHDTTGNLISENPMVLANTVFGGCNNEYKSAGISDENEKDTLIFYELTDTLRIYAGINSTCCIDYGSESSITGDTLVMRINTLNDDFCDCICYYTFDYYFADYSGQGFYYTFYADDDIRFEGKYNMP